MSPILSVAASLSSTVRQDIGIQVLCQVSIALRHSDGDGVAEAIYKVIPWATNEQPTESHQAQLKAEIDQLREGLKQSSSSASQSCKTHDEKAPLR